jgi:4-amino-4-deoxy-L-arabinose transferase-like glycosyltransferase
MYKIAECRYSRNIAFTAAILFAAMPLIWLLRRILSDSILLPFLLLSVLFGITFKNKDTKKYVTISIIK